MDRSAVAWKRRSSQPGPHRAELRKIDRLYPEQLVVTAERLGLDTDGTPLDLRWRIASEIVGEELPEPPPPPPPPFVGVEVSGGIPCPASGDGPTSLRSIAGDLVEIADQLETFERAGWDLEITSETSGGDSYIDAVLRKETRDFETVAAEARGLLASESDWTIETVDPE